MHKLIKRYQGGGGIASPSSIGQLIQNRDLGIIRQQADLNLKEGLQIPGNDSTIGQSKSFNASKVGNAMNLIGGATSALYNTGLTLDRTVNSNDETMEAFRKSAFQSMAQSNNPYMKLAGVVNMGIDMTGGFTDVSEGLGKKTDTLNKIASLALPGAGWFTKRTDTYKMSDNLKQNEASYGGMASEGRLMEKNSGAKLIAGRNEVNGRISKLKQQEYQLDNIMDKSKDAFLSATNSQAISLRNQHNLNGMNWNKVHAAKEGLKLDRDFAQKVVKLSKGDKSKIRSIGELIEYAKQQNPRFIQRLSELPRGIKFIDDNGNESEGSHYLESAGEYVIPRIQEVDGNLKFFNHQDAVNRAIETGNYLKMTPEEAIIFAKEYKQGWPEFFKKFKNGGAVNVIPDGALHKNKHHLENVNEKFEDVTAKGIPVITESAGGDITQHAEVEREEIIFNLDVTKQLEKLMEDGSDEAAIEAGKLLVHEILENTVDNTGLLNKIE